MEKEKKIISNDTKCTMEGECHYRDSHKLPSDPVSTVKISTSTAQFFNSEPKLFFQPSPNSSHNSSLGFQSSWQRILFFACVLYTQCLKERKKRKQQYALGEERIWRDLFHRQSGLPISLWDTPRSPEDLKVECRSWCFSKLFKKCPLGKIPTVLQEAHNPTVSWVMASVTVP